MNAELSWSAGREQLQQVPNDGVSVVAVSADADHETYNAGDRRARGRDQQEPAPF